MTPRRLGAVGYLNARPLVFHLEENPRFRLRFDVPSICARLLHDGETDIGIIPAIEYLRGEDYRIVPNLVISSRGPVASVALYTTRPMSDVRSIVMDTSSRNSVALVRVLCNRLFRIDPAITTHEPDLQAMLTMADAALVIGDNALLWEHGSLRIPEAGSSATRAVTKIDLGEAWTSMTGLPFVWALWAGRPGAVDEADMRALQDARDRAVERPDLVSREYFRDAPEHVDVGTRYLRENIKYYLGSDERAGLELFYRYAADIGLVPDAGPLRFY